MGSFSEDTVHRDAAIVFVVAGVLLVVSSVFVLWCSETVQGPHGDIEKDDVVKVHRIETIEL